MPDALRELQTKIYNEQYCRPSAPPPYSIDLTDALSAANAARERWESGWTVTEAMSNGYAMAVKGKLAHLFGPGEWVPPYVLFARESRTEQPGFYVANGENAAPAGAASRMARIYFNVVADGAVPLMRAMTTLLNRYLVPFRFKSLTWSGAYARADAAVLFFPARYYQIIARLLPSILAGVTPHLRAETPLFTKRLRDGVGLAEDPANGESFGMHRSRLVAQSILNGTTLEAELERNGLSLARPYLRPGSVDLYEVLP